MIVYEELFSHLYLFIFILIILVILSFYFFYTTSPNKLPKYTKIICFYGFCMSLLWIWYTCNILVSLLKDIADLIQIPNSFMGMTILTYGNSIPDLLLNIRLAKKGYGEMAVSSTIAGPLFSLLVGLGISLIKTNLKIGTINFNFFNKSNIINILALIFLFINLICLAIISKLQNYVLNIKLSYFVFTFYCVVLLIIFFIVFL